MTPEEIAADLISHPATDLPQAIAFIRPSLTVDVLRCLGTLANDEQYRNARRALEIATVATAVAEAMNTPEAHGLAQWILGNVYYFLSRYQEALQCYRRAEPFYQEQGETLKTVGLQINQITVLRDMGATQQVLALTPTARETCHKIGPAANHYLANLELTIGFVYNEMGEPEKALATYQRSHDLFVELQLEANAALVKVSSAYVLAAMDRFQAAETLLLAARQALVSADYQQEIGRVDLNLGKLAFAQGNYQAALQHLESAYDHFAVIPLSVEMALVSAWRADIYHQLNLIEEMIEQAQAAAVTFSQAGMRREYAQCLVNQGIGYQRLGLVEAADRHLTRARRELHRQGAWGSLWQLDAQRAELALASGRPQTARRIAQRVNKQLKPEERPSLAAQVCLLLARCALASSPPLLDEAQRQVQQALAIAGDYHLTEMRIQAHDVLGAYWEAKEELLEAQKAYQWGIVACQQLQTNLSLDEFQISFLEDKLALYAHHIRLTHTLVQAQTLRPAVLLASVNQALTTPVPHYHATAQVATTTAVPEWQAQLANLRQSWHWHHNKLKLPTSLAGEETRAELSVTETAALHRELAAIEGQIAELMRRQRVRQSARAAGPEPPTMPPQALLANVQRRLGENEALLAYYEADGRLHAMIATPHDLHLVENLVGASTLERLLAGWRFHLYASQAPLHAVQAQLSRFYQALLKPLAPFLASSQHLYLTLPPQWHELPAAAFYDGANYLVEHCTLTYLSAPDALVHKNIPPFSTAAERVHALVVGNSDHGRLAHALDEASQIAADLPARWAITRLLEQEATLAQFSQGAPHCQLLHLAAHAHFRPDNPFFSWIQLADARLTVADLYHMALRQRPLVVLSACETGRGQPRGGGLLGMGRGFLVAGASGLVVTQWRVDDQATARLMRHFYLALMLPGTVPPIALQAAQCQAIRDGLAPFYWAGFIFLGG